MESSGNVPSIPCRDIRGVQRRQQMRQPIVRKPCIGVAENVDLGILSPGDGKREIVHFLPAVRRPARHEDITSKFSQNGICLVLLGLNDELHLVTAIVLIQDGPDVLLEFLVGPFAGTENNDAAICGSTSWTVRAGVARRTQSID
jgi:hypothetical protein